MRVPSNRRSTRLKGFDYTQNGVYHITICVEKGACALSSATVGAGLCARPQTRLSPIGEVVEKAIEFINRKYADIQVEKYAIMPNHIHLLISINHREDSASYISLQQVIANLKSFTTHQYGHQLWQRSYYDHIIRNDADYETVWQYIDENPDR